MTWPYAAQEREYHSSTVFARASPLDAFPEEESIETVHRLTEARSFYHMEMKGPALDTHSANFWTYGQKHRQCMTHYLRRDEVESAC